MLTREVSFPLPIFFTQETFSNNTALPLTPQTGVSGNNNTAYFFLTVALFQWALISPSSLLGVSFRSQSEMPSASPWLRRTMTNLNEIFCAASWLVSIQQPFQDLTWFGSICAAIDLMASSVCAALIYRACQIWIWKNCMREQDNVGCLELEECLAFREKRNSRQLA